LHQTCPRARQIGIKVLVARAPRVFDHVVKREGGSTGRLRDTRSADWDRSRWRRRWCRSAITAGDLERANLLAQIHGVDADHESLVGLEFSESESAGSRRLAGTQSRP